MIEGKTILNVITDEQLDAFGSRLIRETWEEAKRFFLAQQRQDNMMTTQEVMDWYRCGRTTLYNKVQRGELHPEKIGGKNLFRESEVKFYEQECLKV